MLAHSTTSSLLTPLLFLVAVHGLIPSASADRSGNSDRHDLQERAMEESPEKAELQQMPVAVRKMMGQEAEMFFQEYWQFEQDDRHFTPNHEETSSSSIEPSNARPTPTLARVSTDRTAAAPRGIVAKSLRIPDGARWHAVAMARHAPGMYRSARMATRAARARRAEDVAFLGAHSSTTTVIVNPQVTASPPTSSQSPPPSSATTTSSPALAPLPFGPSSVASTSQSTSTMTTSTTSTTTSTSPPRTISSSSSSSSPSSSSPSTSPSSTSSGLFAPARPTSASVVTTQYLSAEPSCPTGFYQCSAYYHGGCCRVGRDCGLTDCPATASSTVAQGNGVTIVAPSQAAAAARAEGCASGWTTCGDDVGGGCCPPGGFECGRESCTKGPGAKVTGTGVTVGKSAGISSEGARMSRWVLEGRFGVGSLILGMGLGILLLV
ncbi:MAG: hypothetical protein LQ350_002976 [Teloschistes chrysophthalmus]|nr:MAG: hypothetical protein LQ350_002976 [Niorma chrysophthalma]